MSKLISSRALLLSVATSAVAAVACGIAIKRDLTTVPAGQIGFDDMCGLQDYFDSLDGKVAKEPFVLSSLDHEGARGDKTVRGGKARLRFEGEFLLKHLRRVLNENWRRLPEELASASKVDLEVRWAERAGIRRVITDEESELFIGAESWALPYHVCLSELLYGAPLYRQRRALWGLPDPTPKSTGDGGADAARPGADAGAERGHD
jgi:hypothetical protein